VGRTGSGVEVRRTSVRLTFVYAGVPCRETLKLNGVPIAPTVANIKYAQRISGEIRRHLAAGTFDDEAYASYFPSSTLASTIAHRQPLAPGQTASGGSGESFGTVADKWLAAKGRVEAATLDQYRTAVRFWKRLLGSDTPFDELDHEVLATKIGSFAWKSPKSHNNYLISLRGIFKMRFRGRAALDNPTIGIENLPVVTRLPDPLSPMERDKVLADMRSHCDARITAYFTFMFFTGMRPEEAIALRWSDIDRFRAVVRVQRVRTFRGSQRRGSKTHREREVDLVPAALEALKAMEPFTRRVDGDEDADIFQNPLTGRGWHDERAQRDTYWKPSLQRCGIRARRAYCTRHTYCTVALMRGVNPAYIAAQAGHSIKMLLDSYAKWIPGSDEGAQRRLLEAALATNSSPILPQPEQAKNSSPILPQPPKTASVSGNKKPDKALRNNTLSGSGIGRRDWTRTNDPHHVKVVL